MSKNDENPNNRVGHMYKAIFFDRDGVLNECRGPRVNFANSPHQLYLNQGVAEDIAELRAMGYKVFVVTNQGGVGLGHMTKETLDQIHDKLKSMIPVDDIEACTHAPRNGCNCRKPKPGMILSLSEKHNIDLSQSWMVGDMDTDIQAGKAAGCQTYLVKGNEGISEFVNHLKENE